MGLIRIPSGVGGNGILKNEPFLEVPPCPDWSDVGFYLESGTVTIHVQYFGYKSLQGSQ